MLGYASPGVIRHDPADRVRRLPESDQHANGRERHEEQQGHRPDRELTHERRQRQHRHQQDQIQPKPSTRRGDANLSATPLRRTTGFRVPSDPRNLDPDPFRERYGVRSAIPNKIARASSWADPPSAASAAATIAATSMPARSCASEVPSADMRDGPSAAASQRADSPSKLSPQRPKKVGSCR